MMSKEKTINEAKNLIGKQFQLFGYTDLDNEMVKLGAGSIFDELSVSEFINDEQPCWTFVDNEDEVFYLGVTYKIISGNAKECNEKYINDELEEWELEEEARKTTIEITNIEELLKSKVSPNALGNVTFFYLFIS